MGEKRRRTGKMRSGNKIKSKFNKGERRVGRTRTLSLAVP
jgi:hypothetical protein